MRRSVGYGIVAVLIVVVVGLLISQRSPSLVATEGTDAELPTFSSTPSPVRYASLERLAAAIEEAGLGCSDIDETKGPEAQGHTTLKEFETCLLMDSTNLNIDLWLFRNQAHRDGWVDAFRGQTVVVVGPNWIVTPQDEARAVAIQGAIGGEIIPADPSEEESPTP